jgi:hypothetical protein
MGKMRNAYKILVRKPEGERPLRWPRNRREDNTGMDHKEVGWEGMDWMHLNVDRDQ